MKSFRTAPLLAFLVALSCCLCDATAAPAATPVDEEPCLLADGDASWVAAAIGAWQTTERDALGLASTPLPWMVFFDERCVFHLHARHRDQSALADVVMAPGEIDLGAGSVPFIGRPHNGMVMLPEGGELPVQIVSFASTFGDGHPYLVMALPPIWRQAEHLADEPPDALAQLMRSVFVHEMTHTRQSGVLGARLTEIESEYAIEDLDDDIVQRRFGERDGYRAAYETERDLLFAIDAEKGAEARRLLAREVVDHMAARHARYFTGQDAIYAELDRIFLDFEGAANWAAFRSAMLEGRSRDEALDLVRRGGRWWTQDEGLALFLALDSLVPGWQQRIFADRPPSALDLLAEAAAPAGE